MPLQPGNDFTFWAETKMTHPVRNVMSSLWRKHSFKDALCPSGFTGTGERLKPAQDGQDILDVSEISHPGNGKTAVAEAWPAPWSCGLPEEQAGLEEGGLIKSRRAPLSRHLAVFAQRREVDTEVHTEGGRGRERDYRLLQSPN